MHPMEVKNAERLILTIAMPLYRLTRLSLLNAAGSSCSVEPLMNPNYRPLQTSPFLSPTVSTVACCCFYVNEFRYLCAQALDDCQQLSRPQKLTSKENPATLLYPAALSNGLQAMDLCSASRLFTIVLKSQN